MIEDIYTIGKEYAKLENITLDFIQNPKADKIIVIEFDEKDGKLKYQDIRTEDFKKDEWEKYLYRRKSSQGANFTPCAFVTQNKNTKKIDPCKTFKKKILSWFNDIPEELEDLKEVIENKRYEIMKNLKTLELENKVYLLTIKINDRYLKDIVPYGWFLQKIKERFFEDGGRGRCMICNEEKEVGGKFSLSMFGLEFCTFDKQGFAPLFIQKDGWKEISICFDCARYIESGKFFMDNFLNKRGFGFNYYIIPSFLFREKKAIKKFIKKIKLTSYHQDMGIYKGIITKEDRLYNIIEDIDDWLSLNFLIYNRPTSQKFVILNYINDVRPSWLYKILKADDLCRSEWIFQEDQMKFVFGKKQKGGFFKTKNEKISWWVLWLRDIFSSRKEYLNVLSNILSHREITFNILINHFNKFLQKTFKNKNKNLSTSTLHTLAIYLFLRKLRLLRGDKMPEENLSNSEEIFEKYKSVFANKERKTSFLIGTLANYVLYAQRSEGRGYEYGKEPFRKEFNNLLIDQKRLQKIFRKCVEKLNQYRKGVPKWLSENLRNCLDTKEKWKSSIDEISYFFTLGLVLGNLISNKDKEENKEVKKDE